MKVKSVFISRNIDRNGYLGNKIFKNAINLLDYPLITIVAIDSDRKIILPQAEWVYFSSANAVKYFFELCLIETKFQYGCIGEATAAALFKYNIEPNYIGENGNLESSAKQFANLVLNKKVIFPQSDISLQTVQNYLQEGAAINLVLYKTIFLENVESINTDVLVFTSPSNVNSYFIKNGIFEKQQFVAIGKSTANALQKLGQKCSITENTSEESIWKAILLLQSI
jgi:hydroxymethylbilane synthase